MKDAILAAEAVLYMVARHKQRHRVTSEIGLVSVSVGACRGGSYIARYTQRTGPGASCTATSPVSAVEGLIAKLRGADHE